MRLALPRVRATRALSPSLAIALVLAAASTAAASEFPAGKQGYHSYTEMAADVAAVAAAHPDIVSRFSIGKSYQGRDLWAVKISDNVNVDEPEPEVMFDGGHHADEHMSTEMTLHILHWLVDGYGIDPRITTIVDSREIWIVFMVNPDGVEYDISGGSSTTGARTANRRPGPARSARTSTATTATTGAAAAARARTRPTSRIAAHPPSRRRRIARCAPSWPAASSVVASRSGPR